MRILIVKTTSLGDIIQSLSVVTFLHQKFPEATIDWIVEKPFKELLEAHPGIRHIIPIEVRKWKKNFFKHRVELKEALKILREESYDLLIDLQGNVKSGIITKLAYAREKIGTTFFSAPEWPNALFLTHRYPQNKKEPMALQYLSLVQKHFGIKPHSVETNLSLKITLEEEAWIASKLRGYRQKISNERVLHRRKVQDDRCKELQSGLLKEGNDKIFPKKGKKIMVCSGSHWENKKLSLPTWIEFLKKLKTQEECHFFFVWGSKKEEQEAIALHSQFPQSSTLLPKMSLPVWQRFMSEMDLIYTVDSSALHLAATTKTPTYSFFGPSSSAIYKPLGDHHHSLQAPCPYGKTFTKRCPALRSCKTGGCLKDLTL